MPGMMIKRLVFLLFMLTACGGQTVMLPATPTTYAVTLPPQQRPEIADAACPPAGADVGTRHTIAAELDYPARMVAVTQRVTWVNRTGSPLDQIVFSVEPNRDPGVFTLASVTVGTPEQPAAYELASRRLTIMLPAVLTPGCAADITLTFRLNVPPVREGVAAFRGFFGHTDHQFNLSNWLPVVAARLDGAWITHDVAFIGEQIVADPADWTLHLVVINAPGGLILAAPGTVSGAAPRWTVTHTAARDLAFSLSDQFTMRSRAAGDVTVELYTFSNTVVQTAAGLVDAAPAALDAAADSLMLYSDLFGVYPYDRFVVIEGDFPDGMEFSGLVFVGHSWFRTYPGTPQSYLTIITVHEVAHQWWFARVGNDQALVPWLDQALATYSEYIYYEEFYPELRDWWWTFRVNAFVPPSYTTRAMVDASVYEFGTIREYINAVYLRGARMLHTLRQDIGTEAFFDWMRRYAAAGTGRIATPDLFWSLLTPEQLAQTAATRDIYLGTAP